MKIKTRKLFNSLVVNVSGSEDWLSAIYQLFPSPTEANQPKIAATLQISPIDETRYYAVKGTIQYAPFVACSRCNEPINWPINVSFSVRYQPDDDGEAGVDKILTREELDYYFLDAQGDIDLEALLNEQIQLAVPSKTILVAEDGHHCRICLSPLMRADLPISSTGNQNSPFAKLAALKRDEPS